RHTRSKRDWSSDVCSSDLHLHLPDLDQQLQTVRPERGSDRRRTRQPQRDAGAEHLLHLLRPQRRPVEGHRPGQGRGLFPDRRCDLAGAAPLHPLEGGAVLMAKTKRLYNTILTVVMSILCLLWVYPVVLIFLNSLMVEGSFTTSTVFALPSAENFAGAANYIYGIVKMDFLSSFFYSLVITVSSVFLILLCCSMCGWYLTRVNNLLSKGRSERQ